MDQHRNWLLCITSCQCPCQCTETFKIDSSLETLYPILCLRDCTYPQFVAIISSFLLAGDVYDMSGQRIEINEVSAQVLSVALDKYQWTQPCMAYVFDPARADALDAHNRDVCTSGYQRIPRVQFLSSKPGLNLQVRNSSLSPLLHLTSWGMHSFSWTLDHWCLLETWTLLNFINPGS